MLMTDLVINYCYIMFPMHVCLLHPACVCVYNLVYFTPSLCVCIQAGISGIYILMTIVVLHYSCRHFIILHNSNASLAMNHITNDYIQCDAIHDDVTICVNTMHIKHDPSVFYRYVYIRLQLQS